MATAKPKIDEVLVNEVVVEQLAAAGLPPEFSTLEHMRSGNMFNVEFTTFFPNLIKQIVLASVEATQVANPFEQLMTPAPEFGGTQQLLHVNPARRVSYDPYANELGWDVLYQPDISALYLTLNRGDGNGDVYPLDLPEPIVRQACESAASMATVANACSSSLDAAKSMDDIAYCTAIFDDAIAGNRMRFRWLPAVPSTDADYRSLAKLIKQNVLSMRAASDHYTALQLYDPASKSIDSTQPDEVYVILTDAIAAGMDVETLAWAINAERIEVPTRFFSIPAFRDPSTVAVVFDRRYLVAQNQTQRLTSTMDDRKLVNKLTLYVNGFFHPNPMKQAFAIRALASGATTPTGFTSWSAPSELTADGALTTNGQSIQIACGSGSMTLQQVIGAMVVKGENLPKGCSIVKGNPAIPDIINLQLVWDGAASWNAWTSSGRPAFYLYASVQDAVSNVWTMACRVD